MQQQSELEAKRREVREEILTLKENIPSARVLNWFGQLLSKRLTNRSFVYWLSNVFFLNLVTFWIWMLIGLFTNEFEQKPYLWRVALMSIEMQIVGLIVNYSLMRILFDQISDQIVEKIDNTNDLSKLVEWLKSSLSTRPNRITGNMASDFRMRLVFLKIRMRSRFRMSMQGRSFHHNWHGFSKPDIGCGLHIPRCCYSYHFSTQSHSA